MKQFLLFAGYRYYPRGGYEDFQDSFETEEEARLASKVLLEEQSMDWYHIVNTETGDYFS